MSRSIARSASSRALLGRVLDTPELVEAVRALPASTLGALVRDVGLEDAGEIVALATPAQLTGLLDVDLWRAEKPGGDEAFDDERFALWLEVLLEAGTPIVDTLVELPEELVTLGFLRQVWVLDMDALAPEVEEMDPDDAEQLEKSLDGCLCHELEHVRVISRRHDGWDAVIATLIALDERHPAWAQRLFDRLARASRHAMEDEFGSLAEALDHVLEEAEVVASDAAADREDRRAAEGHVTPSQARAFLELARRQAPADILAETQPDPVTRAYVRELDRRVKPSPRPEARPLLAILERAGVGLARPIAPKRKTERGAAPRLAPSARRGSVSTFRTFLESQRSADPAASSAHVEELAYLMNLVQAGGCVDGTSPMEALEFVMKTCERGWKEVGRGGGREELSAVRLFRIGFGLGSKRSSNG